MPERRFSLEEKQDLYKRFIAMIKRREECPEEYWNANWWMGKYISNQEFDQIIAQESFPKWFDIELMNHYIDWLEEMNQEVFQEHLDRQTNHVLF